MNEAIQYMDIIFLAVVAGIVLLRLRSVLGKRTGSEKKDSNLFSYDEPASQPSDIAKPIKTPKQKSDVASDWFDNDDFLNGARGAY